MAEGSPKKKEYSEVPQNEETVTATGKGDGDGPIRLQAKMSLMNGVTVIVGSIIGSGIFISPTGVLKNTGSVNLAIIVWVVSGITSFDSNSFACPKSTVNKGDWNLVYVPNPVTLPF